MSTGESTEGLKWRVTKAVRTSKLSSTAKLVMFVLADVAAAGTAEIPPHRTPSLTVLAQETGLGRSTVARTLLALEADGWVVRVRPSTAEALGRGERTRYQLRVPVSVPSPAPDLVPERDYPLVPDGDYLVPERDHLVPERDTDTDKNSDKNLDKTKPLTSEAEPSDPARPDVEKICQHLADRIVANGSKRPPITKKWRDEGRRLLDLDGKTVEQVIRAIDWCQDDTFWRRNVMSMPKLREKYDRMRLEAHDKAAKASGPARSANRHIDDLPADVRAERNVFKGAVRASQVTTAGGSS